MRKSHAKLECGVLNSSKNEEVRKCFNKVNRNYQNLGKEKAEEKWDALRKDIEYKGCEKDDRGILQRLWNENLVCLECRYQRRVYEDHDKKYKNTDEDVDSFSNMCPGFSSRNVTPPIDLLIVGHSHGGGDKHGYRQQMSLGKEIAEMSEYYLPSEGERDRTYHQQQIRCLIDNLGEDAKWVFTDLVKCYVWRGDFPKKERDKYKERLIRERENPLIIKAKKGKESEEGLIPSGRHNIRLATRYCGYYLLQQIKFLEPGYILCLGKDVYRFFAEIKSIVKSSDADYAKRLDIRDDASPIIAPCQLPEMQRSTSLLLSYFPTGYTADRWVENGGWGKLQNAVVLPWKEHTSLR